MGMGRDQFLGLFWQISPYPLLWQWGYSEHSSMFLTNFGVPGGSFLVARIRKQNKITVNILFIGFIYYVIYYIFKQEPRGSKDATTLSSLIVHFLSFSSSMDGQTDGPTFWCHFLIVLDYLLVHVKFRCHRNIGKDVFRRSKITRDRRTDRRTDGRTDGPTKRVVE